MDIHPSSMQMRVSRWGNSLAVRLPAALVEALGLKEGDEFDVKPGKGRFEAARKMTVEERLKELERFRGSIPKGFKFDREEASRRR